MNVIAFTTPAAPEPAAPNTSSLRRELADAIANRIAVDNAYRSAKARFDRAESLKIEAGQLAQRLKSDLDSAHRRATEQAAKAIEEAIREGSQPPSAFPLAPGDGAELTAAIARHNALEIAAHSQQGRRRGRHGAAKVRAIIEDILDEEGRAVAAEVISTMQAHVRTYACLASW